MGNEKLPFSLAFGEFEFVPYEGERFRLKDIIRFGRGVECFFIVVRNYRK